MIEEISVMKVNKSKSYLIPLLNTEVKIKYLEHLDNTYININFWVECIVLLYNYEISEEIGGLEYLKELEKHKLFISASRLENHFLLVFRFPEQYLEDYYYFKNGQYSFIRQQSKKVIINFISENYKYPETIQDLVHILYKNKERKQKLEESLGIILPDDSELSSKIDEEEETFKYEKYGAM